MSSDGLTPMMKQYHAMRRSLPADVLLFLLLAVALLSVDRAFADIVVRHVEIAPHARESRDPGSTAQDRFLARRAVSAVDVSADGKIVTVGTMAFSNSGERPGHLFLLANRYTRRKEVQRPIGK